MIERLQRAMDRLVEVISVLMLVVVILIPVGLLVAWLVRHVAVIFR